MLRQLPTSKILLCTTLDWELRRVSAYINPNTTPVITGFGVTANRFLRLDVAPNETTFFESTYPIVMTDRDSLTVEISQPDAGGTGIGSAVNFIVNGDTLMSDYGVMESLGNALAVSDIKRMRRLD